MGHDKVEEPKGKNNPAERMVRQLRLSEHVFNHGRERRHLRRWKVETARAVRAALFGSAGVAEMLPLMDGVELIEAADQLVMCVTMMHEVVVDRRAELDRFAPIIDGYDPPEKPEPVIDALFEGDEDPGVAAIDHLCRGGLPFGGNGDAIARCYATTDGALWAGCGGMVSQVAYCPYCGKKARMEPVVTPWGSDGDTSQGGNEGDAGTE